MSFLTTKAAAARTGLTTDAIRWHEKHGRLLSIKVERSPGVFMRLFLEEDVERFARQRAARKVARVARTHDD
jgi:DNA-binding transcriptional MerR regulator